MFTRNTTEPPLKPLAIQVRFAILIISSCMGTAYAQTSIEQATRDPKPANTAATPIKKNNDKAVSPNNKKFTLNNRPSELPYCNDTPNDVLKPFPKDSTSVVANSLKGVMNDTLVLNGQACVVREDVKMQGDAIQYDYQSEQVVATGNAILHTKGGDEISGPTVTYNLSTETGQAAPAEFKIGATDGRGKAESLAIISSRRALMQKAYYTTCRAEDPDWYIKNDLLLVDQDSDTGTGKGSTLVFKGVPIMASPYMEFPLGNRRHSGLLAPTIGYSSSSGAEFVLPYYFNLAPNYDLTLYPGLLSERGAKLGANYRYLTEKSNGSLYADFLYNDQVAKRDKNAWDASGATTGGGNIISNTNRWYWQAKHDTTVALGNGTLTASIDAQRASDNAYLEDFDAPGVDSATRILSSEYALQYNTNNWQMRIREKSNQTLQDANNGVDVPYDFEPQISILGSEQKGNWVASMDAESTRFTHPDKDARAQGWRHAINPSLRYEYRTAGAFITPKIGVNLTKYDLSSVPQTTTMTTTMTTIIGPSGLPISTPTVTSVSQKSTTTGARTATAPTTSITSTPGYFGTQSITATSTSSTSTNYNPNAQRILPIISLDSGLVFERNNASWLGRAAIQTLEPRLYYLYVPYKDQSNIWNFDSNIADFDLSRIYGENIFTGRDRVSNANQTTVGLTSRWLAKDTGEELFQITAAQRYYFDEQRVTLPDATTNTSRKSDVLLSATGAVSKNFWLNGFAQYNMDQNKLLKTDVALRWQPAPKKILSAGYLDNKTTNVPLKSVYVSGEWPLSKLSKNLYGVARVNYDIQNKQLSDAFLGFEYVKDCWIFRIVGERSITSSTKTDNSIYFQLELKGLGALGSDPNDTLQDGIAGYQAVKFEDEIITPNVSK